MSLVKDRNTLPDMEDTEFLQWQALLEQRTGVWIPQHRKAFLITKLSLRMREHDFSSYREYFLSLAQGDWAAVEWAHLVDLLTVHETRFCRDNDGLHLTYQHCQNILANNRRRKRLELWSVGCSTGEEVYSLAMLMADLIRSLKGKVVYFGVTGTDISFPALAQARSAVYPESRLAHMRDDWQKRYTINRDDGYIEIVPAVKDRACFVQGNIKDLASGPAHKYDVIYCQNVLIYFQPPQRQEILNNLSNRLEEGGLLVLAPGEITNWKHPQMIRIDDKNCLSFVKRSAAA